MKIAIVSDTHFGHSKWAGDALSQGSAAMLEASEKADVLLMPGDIFDTPSPSFNTLQEFVSVLRQIKVPILAIHGTHEMRPKGQVNPVQLMHSAGLLANIHMNPQEFEKQGQKVNLVGLGGVPEEFFSAALSKADFKPKEGAFNIFVFHQSLSEFIFSTKQEFISFEDLPEGFDLYVCGHVHKRQEAYGGKMLIPGSTVLTQMKKEEEGEKGYVIYDTLEKKSEFCPIRSRPFYFRELSFENAEPQKVIEAVRKEVEGIMGEAGIKAGVEESGPKTQDSRPIIKIKLLGSMKLGLSQGDLHLPKFECAHVFIDNSLESKTLSQKVEKLRASREQKLSSQEFGLQILSGHLKKSGVEATGLKEMFESLAQGEEIEPCKYLARKKD